jgi:hypothetical protein
MRIRRNIIGKFNLHKKIKPKKRDKYQIIIDKNLKVMVSSPARSRLDFFGLISRFITMIV